MGIQLDWDIEAEKAKSKHLEEDPQQRQARRRGCVRLLVVLIGFGMIAGIVIGGIVWRYRDVTTRLETALRNTVQSEAAALRIGDLATFSDIQRSATDTWLIAQQQNFQNYQLLKQTSDIDLTGNVLALEISGQRGRVQVEEIMDGVSYVRTWFYWNYHTDTPDDVDDAPDGWRHVPPDYTFWGDAAAISDERFEIRYRTLDQSVAENIAGQLMNWLDTACGLFDCAALPALTVDIVSDPLPRVEWATDEAPNTWQMVVPSPYTGLARRDQPFDVPQQIQAATLLAERFIQRATNGVVPSSPYADTQFLLASARDWLVGQFVQRDTGSHLLNSLVQNYGAATLVQALGQLQPTTTIGILAPATGSPSLGVMTLDWRDYVAWRLAIEDAIIQARDEVNLRQLYDPRDPNIINTALARFDVATIPEDRVVSSVSQGVAPDSLPQLQAEVQTTRNAQVSLETIVFNLVDGRWLRAN